MFLRHRGKYYWLICTVDTGSTEENNGFFFLESRQCFTDLMVPRGTLFATIGSTNAHHNEGQLLDVPEKKMAVKTESVEGLRKFGTTYSRIQMSEEYHDSYE